MDWPSGELGGFLVTWCADWPGQARDVCEFVAAYVVCFGERLLIAHTPQLQSPQKCREQVLLSTAEKSQERKKR